MAQKYIILLSLVTMVTGCSINQSSNLNQTQTLQTISPAQTAMQNEQESLESTQKTDALDALAIIPSPSVTSASTDLPKTCLSNKWHNVFFGTIGNQEICMDIYQDGANLTAFYINKNTENKTKLFGTLNNYSITLIDGNQNTLTGEVTSANEIGALRGTFIHNNGDRSSVDLDMAYACGNSLDNFYESIGSNNQEVETFVSELKNNVVSGDKQALAQMVNYPVNVTIDGKSIVIQSQKMFVADYDKFMNKDFIYSISNAYTKYLFNNYQGIMFGDNDRNIWINELGKGLKITSINN